MRKSLMAVALAVLVAYLGACAYLFVKQRDFLYFPANTRVAAAATNYALQRPDAVLRGWVVNPGQRGALLYFGGNGEAIEGNLESFARWFPDHTVYLLAYRGYGASDGAPDEAALFADAIALHDNVRVRHADVDVIGRSLGSGVAIYLASQRPIHKLVLVTPFDSVARIAQSAFSAMPVSLLIEDRFESFKYARQVQGPVLVLAALDDEVIPAASTDALVSSFSIAPRLVRIPAAGHNTIHHSAAYADALSRFLAVERGRDANSKPVR